MTRRQRTLLFLILLGSFLVIAPALALYSQGYRIDIQGRRIAQTGAFYFKVVPTRADIFVDGDLIKRTDFLFGSTLTKNFFPASYFIEIAKEGYHSWQKILEVKERQVTEAKNVLLFKKGPAFQKLADELSRFWISPNRQFALLQQQKPNSSWELRLLNLQTGGNEPFLQQTRSADTILNIQWAKDSRRFLLQRISAEQINSVIYNTSANQPCFETPCELGYLGEGIGNVRLSPTNSEQVFFTKFLNAAQVLFSAQYQEEMTPTPLANNVVAFTAHGNSVSWLDQDGTLWQKDAAKDATAQIFQDSVFIPQQETLYVLTSAGDSILLRDNTTLYLHKRNSTERREILSPALEVVLSPDGKKAAIRNQSELWVLFLKEETEQPQHQAGELVLLTRFSSPIQQLSWITSSYLLFTLEDTIRAIEIDNRGRLNVADIAEFPNPELFFDNEKGTLYVLSEGAFSVSEKIVR